MLLLQCFFEKPFAAVAASAYSSHWETQFVKAWVEETNKQNKEQKI